MCIPQGKEPELLRTDLVLGRRLLQMGLVQGDEPLLSHWALWAVALGWQPSTAHGL